MAFTRDSSLDIALGNAAQLGGRCLSDGVPRCGLLEDGSNAGGFAHAYVVATGASEIQR